MTTSKSSAAHQTTIASTYELQGFDFKNRFVKGAMSEGLANKAGEVNSKHLKLYETWAQGGLGCSITGNVMVDINAKNEPGVVAIEDEHDLAGLTQWANIGKQYNMIQLVQLSHPGRQCPKGLNKETVAPSAIPFSPALSTFFGTPRALTEAEIQDIIKRFGNAARICKKAGFEGVQLHGAHGYLISQFLSPLTNQRTDQWGGSIKNRMRFLLEVYKEVRQQTGDNFIVSVKLNSADFQRGGFTEDDAIAVFKAIDAVGIDLIEISGGTYEAPAMAGAKRKKPADQPAVKASTQAREAYFLEFAEKIRQQVKTALMVTGGFRTRQGMDSALQSGACDFIGIARPLAVETDAPDHLLAGNDSVRYAVKPIKTGLPMLDKMAVMEVIWYAAQFKAIGLGKKPKPNLSPLLVLANYARGNIKAILQRRTRLRA